MRKLLWGGFCLLFLGTVVMAQKVDSKWHCSPSGDSPSMKVGDVADHVYALAQGTCEATSSTGGEKSGAWTEFQERWKTSYSLHGRFNVTMADGGMVYYTYERAGKPDEKKMLNKWKIVSGTGKHKGITGSGSCTGMWNQDGSADFHCTGTTTMASAKPEPAK